MRKSRLPVIETKELSIKFGDFTANNNINISFYSNEIHAIVGENGAGKSTLMKMLYGIYKPTSGEISVNGVVQQLSPQSAIESGIGMVFQDFRLIDAFTAFENIYLSLPRNRQKIKKSVIKNEIKELSLKYNIPVNPDMYVWEMDLGQRQRVEIIKVLMMGNTKVMIFDEPTSVLTHHEALSFIDMLIELKKNGHAVVLITHKLHEVMCCADVISVLRQGEIIDTTYKTVEYDKDSIVSKMMGEEVEKKTVDYNEAKKLYSDETPINLLVKELSVKDDHGRTIIKDASFKLREGEILGVAGISGRGQKELLETIFGVRKFKKGSIVVNGKDVSKYSVAKRIESGISLISEDPKRDNVVPSLSILEHMPLAGVELNKGFAVNWQNIKERLKGERVIDNMGVPEFHREMNTLSGGNIQRSIFARAIIRNPKVLLASYPSRGLDVRTVNMVHETLISLKRKKASVLLISEDLEELFSISDRIIVISDNKIYGKYNPQKISSVEIGEKMLGNLKEGA